MASAPASTRPTCLPTSWPHSMSPAVRMMSDVSSWRATSFRMCNISMMDGLTSWPRSRSTGPVHAPETYSLYVRTKSRFEPAKSVGYTYKKVVVFRMLWSVNLVAGTSTMRRVPSVGRVVEGGEIIMPSWDAPGIGFAALV